MDGDRWGGEAFDALFRDSYTVVVRSVEWIVGDREVAREIASDAFVAALVHWRKVSGYEKPGAWVRRVAIRDAVRAAKRLARIVPVDVLSAAPDRDDAVVVRAAVAELAPAQRAAVVLHYLHDLPVGEVARVLGCSEGTAKTHLFRARAALRTRLSEEDD
jgi:RNA polymerase sigma-70 factor (ECF subfamily)